MMVHCIAFCCQPLYFLSEGRSLWWFSLQYFVVSPCIYCQKGVLFVGSLCSILFPFPLFTVRRAFFMMVHSIQFCCQPLYLLSERCSFCWFCLQQFVLIPSIYSQKGVLYDGSLYSILLSVPLFSVKRAFSTLVPFIAFC